MVAPSLEALYSELKGVTIRNTFLEIQDLEDDENLFGANLLRQYSEPSKMHRQAPAIDPLYRRSRVECVPQESRSVSSAGSPQNEAANTTEKPVSGEFKEDEHSESEEGARAAQKPKSKHKDKAKSVVKPNSSDSDDRRTSKTCSNASSNNGSNASSGSSNGISWSERLQQESPQEPESQEVSNSSQDEDQENSCGLWQRQDEETQTWAGSPKEAAPAVPGRTRPFMSSKGQQQGFLETPQFPAVSMPAATVPPPAATAVAAQAPVGAPAPLQMDQCTNPAAAGWAAGAFCPGPCGAIAVVPVPGFVTTTPSPAANSFKAPILQQAACQDVLPKVAENPQNPQPAAYKPPLVHPARGPSNPPSPTTAAAAAAESAPRSQSLKMKYCPNCGAEASRKHKFCPYCRFNLQQFARGLQRPKLLGSLGQFKFVEASQSDKDLAVSLCKAFLMEGRNLQ